jgi:formylglycine-generating enzyme required for sulfatase activity
VPSTKSGTFVPPQPSNFPGRRNTINDALGNNDHSDLNTRTREGKPEGRPPYRTPNLIGSEEEDILSTSLAMSAVRLPNSTPPPNKQTPVVPPVKNIPTSNRPDNLLPLDDDEEELRRTSLSISAVKLPETKPKTDFPAPSLSTSTSSHEDQLEILNTLLPGGAIITPPPSKPFSPTQETSSNELSPELFANTVSTPSLAPTSEVEALLSETVVMDAPIASNPFPNEHELDTGTMAALYSNTVVSAPATTDQEIHNYLQNQAPNNVVDSFPSPPTLDLDNVASMYAPTQVTSAPSHQDIQQYQQEVAVNYDPTVILTPSADDQLSETVIMETPLEQTVTATNSLVDESTVPLPLSGLGLASPDNALSEEDPFRTVAVPFSPPKTQSQSIDFFDPFATASTDVIQTNAPKTPPPVAVSTPTPTPAPVMPPPVAVSTPTPTPAPVMPPPVAPVKPPLAATPVAIAAKAAPPAATNPIPASTPTKPGTRPLMILAIAGGLLFLTAITVIGFYFLAPSTPTNTVKVPTPTPPVKLNNPSPSPKVPPPPPVPAIPAQMALVPNGEYEIGCDEGMPGCTDTDRYSSPKHTVAVSAFYIDQYEVTNEAYAKFLKATGHRPPSNWRDAATYSGKAQDPVVNVSWEDANAYATWAGKRLPTEQEWEIAASGRKHLPYPWGLEIADNANTKAYNANEVLKVGSLANGKSEFGAFDMSGNVWEWTASAASSYPNSKTKLDSPANKRVIRGGSFLDTPKYCTTYFRGFVDEKTIEQNLGFRCAQDVPTKEVLTEKQK